ncbi:MAG: hypothetical protein QW379_04255 [Thermoplasmata archaeon]
MRKIRGDGKAVSALFDAIIFFIILLVATGAIHLSASLSRSQEAAGASSSRSARLASEIQTCALECTVGPVNWTSDGETLVFSGTVFEGLLALSDRALWNSSGGPAGLERAVREVYDILTPDGYHFAVQLFSGGSDILFISDRAASPSEVPHPRSACSAPLELEEEGVSVTLYIWR